MIECLGVLTAMVALLGLAFAKRVLLGARNGKSEIVGAAELKMLEEVSRPSQYSEWEDQFREASVESAHRLAGNNPADAWKVWGCCCDVCGISKREHAKITTREARATHVAEWVAKHVNCDVEVELEPITTWGGDTIYTRTYVSCHDHDAEELLSSGESRAYDAEIGEWEHWHSESRREQTESWPAAADHSMLVTSEGDYSYSPGYEACGSTVCAMHNGHAGPCRT